MKAKPVKLTGGLQSQHAAADDGRVLRAFQHFRKLCNIRKVTDRDHALFFLPLERRNKAFSAQGVDQLVIRHDLAVIQAHPSARGINGHGGSSQHQLDLQVSVPLRVMDAQDLRLSNGRFQILRQHRPVDGKDILRRDNADRAGPVPFADRLRR